MESKTRWKAEYRINVADACAMVACAGGGALSCLTPATASLKPCIRLGQNTGRNVVVATAGKPVPAVGCAGDVVDRTQFAAGTADAVVDAAVADGAGSDLVRAPHAAVRNCSRVVAFGTHGCSLGGSPGSLQRSQEPRRER